MRIRFTEDSTYETGGPGVGPKFAKGLVLDSADVAKALGMAEATDRFSEAFLARWVQRGRAVEVDGRATVDMEAVAAVAASAPEAAPATQPKADIQPVAASVVSQPLGTAKRGRASSGNG